MTNTPVILTHNLTKSHGSLAAVQELNLSAGPHRITAFLGQNGAGKSTTDGVARQTIAVTALHFEPRKVSVSNAYSPRKTVIKWRTTAC